MSKRSKRVEREEDPEDPENRDDNPDNLDNDPDYIPEPEPTPKSTPKSTPKPTPKPIPKSTSKPTNMEEIKAQLEQLAAKLQVSENRQKECEDKIKGLTENQNQFQIIETPIQYVDIKTQITAGDQIQLDSYKAIPEFAGDQKQYRSWREQVTRRMTLIDSYNSHPKYEAALGIIRAKITKTASDILINNNTPYNIDAIIDRLDFSYADHRPLYVVEAEMTSIKQGNKTLQEYYDAVNQAVNVVITKIVMTYKITDEQRSLTEQTQQKAVRTFIIGLKSTTTRNILYGQSPKTLATAFAIAQTVFHDNQYLQLDYRQESQKAQTYGHGNQQKYNPNFNSKKPQHTGDMKKHEQMEVDTSNRIKQSTNWRQTNPQTNGQKRDFESPRQNVYQPQKVQRINQLQDEGSPPNQDEDSQHIPEDLISNSSHVSNTSATASAFLEE